MTPFRGETTLLPLIAPLGSNWPFPSVNGEQTPDSKELEANKAAHPEPKFNPSTCEEALL